MAFKLVQLRDFNAVSGVGFGGTNSGFQAGFGMCFGVPISEFENGFGSGFRWISTGIRFGSSQGTYGTYKNLARDL